MCTVHCAVQCAVTSFHGGSNCSTAPVNFPIFTSTTQINCLMYFFLIKNISVAKKMECKMILPQNFTRVTCTVHVMLTERCVYYHCEVHQHSNNNINIYQQLSGTKQLKNVLYSFSTYLNSFLPRTSLSRPQCLNMVSIALPVESIFNCE